MANLMIRHWFQLLLTCLLIGIASRADAGTPVTVTYSGVGTGMSSGTFSGYFIYDQSQSGTAGVFKFESNAKTHVIDYKIGNNPAVLGTNTACQPFAITTSGSSFHQFALQATAPTGTTVSIVLPTPSVTLSATTLPLCDPNVFPSTANSGSTFALSGGTSFTGNITSLSCSVPPAPAPQGPPVLCYVVYVCPAPVTCPVYVCQPRPACCFSRLFHRGSLRFCCR